ncbi:MAG: DUF922 domain-containing protein [Cyclobacteriaceae bacterium]
MIKVLLFLILWLPATDTHSQPAAEPGSESISWNEFYKLQWHDFQGEPGEGSIGDAGAVVQIKAKPFLVKKKIQYDVVALFNKRKSWSTDQSETLLAHEQLHFDIAEVYARKIRKKINELNDRGVNNIKTYNAAIQDLLLESNHADQQYDLETLHGALPKKQAVWSKQVKEDLSALHRYKKTKRVIRIAD